MRDAKHRENPIVIKSTELAHAIYRVTRNFPKEELFGLVSQMRRASTSVPVNIIEGFSRKGTKHYKQFLLVSYGSVQELKYFIEFSKDEEFISKKDFERLYELADECAKMLYKTIERLD